MDTRNEFLNKSSQTQNIFKINFRGKTLAFLIQLKQDSPPVLEKESQDLKVLVIVK